ncbi:DUF2663 family protein [Anoxybacillus sp. KU2-6(11)]|uniref:DUF2663 family protein n=1 Tax=Anoxybacillus sp. KU2-6(11) TaxID=1535751 RepID=UPI000AECF3A4|nr:DUF2663 family protein [Anoxybacillus sp. KU2-6(11)]
MIFPMELDEVTKVILQRIIAHKKEWDDMKKKNEVVIQFIFIFSRFIWHVYISNSFRFTSHVCGVSRDGAY